MKKLAVLAVALLASTTAMAGVAVLQNGKTVTYEQGTPVMTSGEAPVQIVYDTVSIYVPQGQRVLISKAKDGKVLITGTNLSGVEVGGKRISSKGLAAFTVEPKPGTAEVERINGDISVVSIEQEEQEAQKEAKKAQKATKATKATKAVKTTSAKVANAAAQTVEFPTVSEYVNEVVTQQTAQNTEETVLSCSSPSGC